MKSISDLYEISFMYYGKYFKQILISAEPFLLFNETHLIQILLEATELEESPFMEVSFLTRILHSSTPDLVFFRWRMPGLILMDHRYLDLYLERHAHPSY